MHVFSVFVAFTLLSLTKVVMSISASNPTTYNRLGELGVSGHAMHNVSKSLDKELFCINKNCRVKKCSFLT